MLVNGKIIHKNGNVILAPVVLPTKSFVKKIEKYEMENLFSDEYFMKQALNEANIALEKDEVPIGAIIVQNNRIIARAHNLVETLNDATAHAEMQAFTSASNALGGKYLNKCTLYVTLEPCVMCAGAAHWTQIGRVVFGANDEKRGFLKNCNNILHSKIEITKNVLENECSEILKTFFINKR